MSSLVGFRISLHWSLLRRRYQDCPSWSRRCLSQSMVPMFVQSCRSVPCHLPEKKRMCLLWCSTHLFECKKKCPQVIDSLRLFYSILCHHDVPDFLQLAVGVVWCFGFNCEVPTVGRTIEFCCVCEHTIRPEMDPWSLLCHGFVTAIRGLRASLC